MKKQKTEKGFVMILALFLTVAFATAIAGDFLSLTRQQRSVQQAADRIRTQWANEALLDYTLFLFSRFVKKKGGYPDLFAVNNCQDPYVNDADCEVHDNLPGEGKWSSFGFKLQCWWNGDCDSQPSGGVKASFGDLELKAESVQIRQVEGTLASTDLSRKYNIRFQTERTTTRVKTRISYTIQLNAGKLTDFFSFANTDLEICPGPSFNLEGPIFSNKDVYLMTAPNSTLTLSPPEGLNPSDPDYYAIHAVGNIYFYFKRALAKNYFLEPGRNDKYLNGVADFFRTDTAQSDDHHIPQWGGYDLNKGTGFGSYFGWPFDDTRGLERLANGLPLMYYFKNNIHYRFSALGTNKYPRIVLNKNPGASAGQEDIVELSYPSANKIVDHLGANDNDHQPFGGQPLWTAQIYHPDVFYTTFSGHDSRIYGNTIMNVSASMPMGWYSSTTGEHEVPTLPSIVCPNKPDGTPQFWTPENPCTATAPSNPNWAGNSVTESLIADATHHPDGAVEGRSIPIGDALETPHILIEPAKFKTCKMTGSQCDKEDNCDCPDVVAQKLEYKAHVQFRCRTEQCKSYSFYIYDGNDTPGSDGYAVKNKRKDDFSLTSSLSDWRLGGSLGVLSINMGALKDYLANQFVKEDQGQLNVKGAEFRGFIVYVETADAPYSLGDQEKIALVKLTNGSSLPRDGLTIATNGRLWVEGDYNTHRYAVDPVTKKLTGSDLGECSAQAWRDKACHFPPAAIFSDSFGILSGSGGHNQPVLANRIVNQDVMVNTAIFSGYLPSQLEKAYPDCNTQTALDPTKCFDHPQLPVTKADSEARGMGGEAYSRRWYTLYSNNQLCNGGFNELGFPMDPDTCPMTLDTAKGIYNTRTIRFTHHMLRAMRDEQNGYQSRFFGSTVDTPAFAGCQNRRAVWQTNYALMDGVDFRCPDAPNISNHPWDKINARTVLDWTIGQNPNDSTHFTAAEMDVLKDFRQTYKIPVETLENGNWQMWCCTPENMAEARLNSVQWEPGYRCKNAYKCSPTSPGWNKNNIYYREFNIDFNFLPEVAKYNKATKDFNLPIPTLPFYSTGFMNCNQDAPRDKFAFPTMRNPLNYSDEPLVYPGRSRHTWVTIVFGYHTFGFRPLSYEHGCQVEPAPLMGGTGFVMMQDDWEEFRKYDSMVVTGASNCQYLGKGGGEAGPGAIPVTSCTNYPKHETPFLNAASYYPAYWYGRQMPLYVARYSGGLENLINYQELWELMEKVPGTQEERPQWTRNIYLGGILTKAWDSENLKIMVGNNVKPAYWRTDYYAAPARHAYYNADLRTNPPPGTPGVYRLKRLRYRELHLNTDDTVIGK